MDCLQAYEDELKPVKGGIGGANTDLAWELSVKNKADQEEKREAIDDCLGVKQRPPRRHLEPAHEADKAAVRLALRQDRYLQRRSRPALTMAGTPMAKDIGQVVSTGFTLMDKYLDASVKGSASRWSKIPSCQLELSSSKKRKRSAPSPEALADRVPKKFSSEDLGDCTGAVLEILLKRRKLPFSGKKAVKIRRLLENKDVPESHIQAEFKEPEREKKTSDDDSSNVGEYDQPPSAREPPPSLQETKSSRSEAKIRERIVPPSRPPTRASQRTAKRKQMEEEEEWAEDICFCDELRENAETVICTGGRCPGGNVIHRRCAGISKGSAVPHDFRCPRCR